MNILKQKKLLLITVLLTAVFFSVPFYSHARGLVPCGGYKDDGTREAPCNVCDVFSIIALVTNWLIAAAGIYAVFQIVNAGFWLVTTMGEEEKITKYKNALTSAVVGFVLVMIAFIIVNTAVNYLLLNGNAKNLLVDLRNPFDYLNSSGACHK
jgi:amino acid transporter